MKKLLALALTILLGTLLFSPSGVLAEEKKETEGKAKVPKLLFKTGFGEQITNVLPLKNGERVAISTHNKLYLYDKKGILLWQKNFDDDLKSGINLLDEENILVNTKTSIYLLDEKGRINWSYQPGSIYAMTVSKESEYFACTYLDQGRVPQIELFKHDEDKTKSLWKTSLSSAPLDSEDEYWGVPYVLDAGNSVLIDKYIGGYTLLDRHGNILRDKSYSAWRGLLSFDIDKLDNFFVIDKDTATKYDLSGNILSTFKLPDGLMVGQHDDLYYIEDKKVLYLKLSAIKSQGYLLSEDGKVLSKGENLFFSSEQVLSDALIGIDDGEGIDKLWKYDFSGTIIFAKNKPPSVTTSFIANEKKNFMILGLDNLKKFNSPTVMVFDLNGNLLWQEKLGSRTFLGYLRKSKTPYLPVIVDDTNINYYDLKPILKGYDSNEK